MNVKIYGVPLDLGQSRRGVDMGPSAMRTAGLPRRLASLGHTVEDGGDVPVVIPETQPVGDARVRYASEIADICRGIAGRVERTLEDKALPLTLGGDHALAIGTVAGAGRYFQNRNRKLGLIWLDAHADMNTPETTPSGNVHGMALACCLRMGLPALTSLIAEAPVIYPQNTVLIGARDIDPQEKTNVRSSGVHLFTMRDIDELGMRKVMEEAVNLASEGTSGFQVSLDMDFVDPRDAPGVGTPSPGGVTYREAHLAMEIIADAGKMRTFEVVEVNPILDSGNQTAALAVELTLSAFGKRII